MNNRVFGLVGFETRNNVFNAGFDGQPRQNTRGEFIVSDKSYKYAFRRYLDSLNKQIFVLKTLKEDTKGKLIPKSIEERYKDLFGEIPKNNDLEVLKNLLSCTDVMNFGIAFPVKDCKLDVTGVAQLEVGVNNDPLTSQYTLEQLSPYRDDSKTKETNEGKEEKSQSTIGSKTVVDKAHYLVNVFVNPSNLKCFKDYGIEYTEQAYEDLKLGLVNCITALNSQTKIGSINEFGIFIKLKENSLFNISFLERYIDFSYPFEGKNVIDMNVLTNILNKQINDIEEIEIYYNSTTTELLNYPTNAIIKELY